MDQVRQGKWSKIRSSVLLAESKLEAAAAAVSH